jgi:hypothetical protein
MPVQNEKCLNPFKPKCGSTEITVYIEVNGSGKIPVCRECWEFLAENAVWDGDGIKLIEPNSLTKLAK